MTVESGCASLRQRKLLVFALLGAAASMAVCASASAQDAVQIISHRYPALEFFT
jgi:hypothetical protein